MKGRKAAAEHVRNPISRTGLLTAGSWHPFPHEQQHSDLSECEFASEGCISKQWLEGHIQVCYRPAALISLLSSYRGGKFPVHLIFYFALKHKRGKGLLYEICLTDS